MENIKNNKETRLEKWDKRFMEVARVVGTWCTCHRHQVGAVIVKDKRIVATGYNGAPAGVGNCLERGVCLRDELKIASGTHAEMCYAVHAEQNAIIQAAKLGISVEGATIYVTHQPCSMCTRIIVNSGIKRIVYGLDYPDEFSLKILKEAGIDLNYLPYEASLMDYMSIVSIILGVLIVAGFAVGFLLSWKKSLIRALLVVISFLVSLVMCSKIANFLMTKFVNGLVLSVFGKTIDFEEVAGDLAEDLLGEGSALTNFATALLNIIVKILAFFIVFISLVVVALIVFWIVSAIMSSRKKKKSVGEQKVKVWERFVGGFVGIVSTFVLCIALFSPVFGVMSVCDKFLTQDTSTSASAYNETCFVAGKFYTEDDKIGKVEGYLEKYETIRNNYNSSFAGFVFKYTGVDALGRKTFTKLSTVKQGGITVNLTSECVNIVNVYNLYKKGFVENKFNMANDESVTVLEDIYAVSRESEVLRSFVVDLVPKMATKWSNGEKFMNTPLPVKGDTKEVVIDILDVYKSKEFNVLDRNFSVFFDMIRVANTHDIISSINGGAKFVDVIDTENFVKDEILTLVSSPEYKKALPNIMTTVMKISYKSVLGDPGTKLDQEFTQEQIVLVNWENEATRMQNIIYSMYDIFDTKEVIDCLSDFGVVIDNARGSKILSKPVKILMSDYIEQKVTGLGESKQTILNAINNKWDSETYKFEYLFTTLEVTAKVAKEVDSMEMSDMASTIKSLIKNDTSGEVRATIEEAVEKGAIKNLVGDENKALIYEDLLVGILYNSDNTSVDQDLEASQVVSDIVNTPASEGKSVLDYYGNEGCSDEDKADIMIEKLYISDTTMNVLAGDSQTDVKASVDKLSEDDQLALKGAVERLRAQNGDAPNTKLDTLETLFVD